MNLYVLFMQRKEQYEGEFGPEALACIDEYVLDDGGSAWWQKTIAEKKASHRDEAAGFAIVKIDIPAMEIRKLCLGEATIKGEIVK